VNKLAQTYPDEITRVMAKYPADQKRSAVMPLLYLAQREAGYITKQAMGDIAELCDITTTEVASIIGFYTLYHAAGTSGSAPGGRYRIQVCTDLPCALRGADEFLQKLCQNIGLKVGETTPDGLVTIEEVTCLAGCHRAPMFQVQGDGEITYHENQTVESALELVSSLRQKASRPEEGA
jgi:NADH-quinone oxidoreductase subunit E